MAEFVKVASISDVQQGGMKVVLVKGKQIALANVGGQFFAFDDVCTHALCSLGGEGVLSDHIVVCGCHGAQFDVTNGAVLSLPATVPLKTYVTKTEGNDVLVEI